MLCPKHLFYSAVGEPANRAAVSKFWPDMIPPCPRRSLVKTCYHPTVEKVSWRVPPYGRADEALGVGSWKL